MRGIAKLLFGDGDDGDRLHGLLAGDDDWWRAADQVRRDGEWCGSTPGSDSGRASRERPVTRHPSPWEFRLR
jgi:hypothetical protein